MPLEEFADRGLWEVTAPFFIAGALSPTQVIIANFTRLLSPLSSILI